jgi:tetratricopeptide (TPR) repeat protein
MAAAFRRPETARRLLAGLFVALLATACVPAQTGGDGATPPDAATTSPDPAPSTDRQLAIAHRQLGLGLEAAGDIDGAVDEYLASLALGDWPVGEGNDTPHDDLARICARPDVDAAAEVVRACSRAVASFQFSFDRLVEFLSNRADAHLRLGDLDRALADYQTVLELETDNLQALLGRARVRAQAGDHLAALPDYKRAIAGGLDRPETRHARAQSWVALGRFEEAVADYDQILADPQGIAAYPGAYRDRAAAHCQLGQADAAAIGWQVWLGATPGGAEAVQDMLWTRGYLRGPVGEDFSPAALAALRAWTSAGCPESGQGQR